MAKKILIIENDPTAMRLTEFTLKQRGYQVLATCNGLEGIIAAQKEEPDLIILDIMLPGIDGFEVCKRLRAGVQTSQIPILIISGKTQQEDIAAGFRAGADDYLSKPASPSEIVGRVESLISQKQSCQAKTIAFARLDEGLETMMILANIAAVFFEQGKQVTLVDAVTNQIGSSSQDTMLSQYPGRVILETDSTSNTRPEPAFEVLPSGVRMLHVDEVSKQEDGTPTDSIDLLQKMGKVNDYLLIDLLLKPVPFTRAVLTNCDLIVILSGYEITNMPDVKNTVTLLNFLGITPDKIAMVLVDPKGKFPSVSLGNVKPYIEVNLGITLAGAISYDAKMHQLSYLENQPVIQSNPGGKLAQDIKQIAQYITAYSYAKQEPRPPKTRVPSLEKSK
jgi:DNA-binding response OmpR family regulator